MNKILVLVVLALMAAPLSQAQTANTLWATADAVDPMSTAALCGGLERGLAMSFETPASADAYMGGSQGPNGCFTYLSYTAEKAFQATNAAELHAFIGCDAPAPAGYGATVASFRIDVFKNGVEIYSEERNVGEAVCFEPVEYIFGDLGISGTTFAVGDVLSIGILPWYVQAPDVQMYMQVGSSGSYLSLPGLGTVGDAGEETTPEVALPETFTELVEGDSLSVAHSFENASIDSYVYNWTHNLTALQFAYDVVLTNGSVTFEFLDESETSWFQATITDSFNGTEEFPTVPAGNWTVSIDYDSFEGTFNLTAGGISEDSTDDGEPTDTSTSGPTSTEDDTDDGTDGGSTDDSGAGGEPKKKSPGPGAALLLLGAALVARRRR